MSTSKWRWWAVCATVLAGSPNFVQAMEKSEKSVSHRLCREPLRAETVQLLKKRIRTLGLLADQVLSRHTDRYTVPVLAKAMSVQAGRVKERVIQVMTEARNNSLEQATCRVESLAPGMGREPAFRGTQTKETMAFRLAELAHDIGGTLQIVTGLTGNLEMGYLSESQAKAGLQTIVNTSRDVERLADKLLLVAAGESRCLMGNVGVVELSQALVRALSVAAAGSESKIRVESECHAGGRVQLDSTEIRSAIWNLGRNAVQAMPRGGTIRLAIDRRGSYLRLRLSDTGPGMPPKVLERLFEPWNTGNPQTGYGLGLSSVHGVVHEHGGQIDVDTSSAGTTFTLRLPLTQPD